MATFRNVSSDPFTGEPVACDLTFRRTGRGTAERRHLDPGAQFEEQDLLAISYLRNYPSLAEVLE